MLPKFASNKMLDVKSTHPSIPPTNPLKHRWQKWNRVCQGKRGFSLCTTDIYQARIFFSEEEVSAWYLKHSFVALQVSCWVVSPLKQGRPQKRLCQASASEIASGQKKQCENLKLCQVLGWERPREASNHLKALSALSQFLMVDANHDFLLIALARTRKH